LEGVSLGAGGGAGSGGEGGRRKKLVLLDPEDEGGNAREREEDEVRLAFHEWIGKVPVGQSSASLLVSLALCFTPQSMLTLDDFSFSLWALKFVPSDKDVFTMVIAHEFFDALPINVFQVSDSVCRVVEQGFGG